METQENTDSRGVQCINSSLSIIDDCVGVAMESALFDGKLFTVEEARKSLPLVRAIVGDIVKQAKDLRERHERLQLVFANHKANRRLTVGLEKSLP